MIRRLFDSKEGGILLSILLGFGLTALFRKTCENCIIIKSKTEEITKGVYKLESGKCVKFEPKLKKCELKNL